MEKLSHVNEQGKVQMVDVGAKIPQLRIAKASGRIMVAAATIQLVTENKIKKGNVLTIAQIAGIQAAKQTAQLIPLCHPLQISKIDVDVSVDKDSILVISEVASIGQTGVEMEALTAVSAALLTVYDMCKAVDKKMCIGEIKLLEKIKHDIK
ncbi:MAG: cyclic pyranopterin monophosphate synthase MoaC [Sedimentisphaerales bacterium]|nr:cyclic pyranopterin monophosphate synthase MoaC [Sedimentisphaerales bacterium]